MLSSGVKDNGSPQDFNHFLLKKKVKDAVLDASTVLSKQSKQSFQSLVKYKDVIKFRSTQYTEKVYGINI